MSVKRIKVIYLLLLTMLSITSCSVNPVTGQNEFLLMSKQQEITLGEKNYRGVLQIRFSQITQRSLCVNDLTSESCFGGRS